MLTIGNDFDVDSVLKLAIRGSAVIDWILS